MKLGIVVYSGEPETVWNAFRFGNFAAAMGDEVQVFLLGQGVAAVEPDSLSTAAFDVKEHFEAFLASGGQLIACGTCLEIHRIKAPQAVKVGTLKEIYDVVAGSDKVVTF
ncbi:MAG: DsrE family protein [Chloroflexota bacterium]